MHSPSILKLTQCFRQREILLALSFSLATPASLLAGDTAAALPGANAPGMRGVVYGLFDDQTGARLARLKIEHVDLEYEHRGFLRVAWRPVVVLNGVTLDVSAGVAWPAAGAKIVDALQVAGRRKASVLRDVHIRLAGEPARELTAVTGNLRADGALELTGVKFSAGGSTESTGDRCLWLAGSRAGQLMPISAAVVSPAESTVRTAPQAFDRPES